MAQTPQQRRRSFHLSVVLVAVNLLLLNWIALGHFSRVDLTRDRLYTLHPETVRILTELDDLVTLRVYLSDRTFSEHEAYAYIPREVRDWITEFVAVGQGRVVVDYKDPSGDEELAREAKTQGLTEIQVQGQRDQSIQQFLVFCGIVVSYGGKEEVIQAAYSDRIELELALAITRLTQRETVTIGFNQSILLPDGITQATAPQYGLIPDLYDLEGTFRRLKLTLESEGVYDIESVPTTGEIPPHIDVLVVANSVALLDVERFHIDQYLMAGGKVIFLADGVDVDGRTRTFAARNGANDEFFGHYGFTVEKCLVLDEQCYGNDVRLPRLLSSNFDTRSSMMNGVKPFLLPYASSIRLNPPGNVEGWVLARTSNLSWAQRGFFTPIDEQPKLPTKADDYSQHDMIGMLRGEFTSYFNTHRIPEGAQGSAGPSQADFDEMRRRQELETEKTVEGEDDGAAAENGADDGGAIDAASGDEMDDAVAEGEEHDEFDEVDDEDDEDGDDDFATSLGSGGTRGLFVREKAPKESTILIVGTGRFLMNSFLGYPGNYDFFVTLLDRLTTGGRLSQIRQRSSVAPSIRADLTLAEKRGVKYGGMLLMPILVALVGGGIFFLRRQRRAELVS